MLAVALPAAEALETAGAGSDLVVAAYNSPISTVLSGDAAVIDAACGEARRIATERRGAMPEASVREAPDAGKGLEAPPTLSNFDEFGEGDE